jgi:hypothetical protein
MRPSIREIAPDLARWIEQAGAAPLLRYINENPWINAVIGTTHILFLTVLGGAMLVLNLRVLGVVLAGVPMRDVTRMVRPVLLTGIIGTVATGILLGLATLSMLLSNPAFLVKMVALLAGIGLTLAVLHAASAEEEADRPVRGAAALAIASTAVWIAALVLFATTDGLGPGAFLVALAGLALFAAYVRRGRAYYAAALAIVLGGGLVAVEWTSSDGLVGPAWLPLVPLGGAIAIAAVWGLRQRLASDWRPPSSASLAAFASTLAWITVAAAGRWIAFA